MENTRKQTSQYLRSSRLARKRPTELDRTADADDQLTTKHTYATVELPPSHITHFRETSTSDAIERIARLLGVSVDLDDPEPALVAAVERAVAVLVQRRGPR